MPLSEQLQPVIGFVTSIAVMAGVAVMKREVTICPENDVSCVEREAKRLYEVTKIRRY